LDVIFERFYDQWLLTEQKNTDRNPISIFYLYLAAA
jgi:hypothetical protein